MRTALWNGNLFIAALLLLLTINGCAEQGRPAGPSEKLTIQPNDDAKTVATKAVQAHGGTDKISRWSRGYVKFKTTLDIIPADYDEAVLEDTFDLPGHFKRVIHGNMGGEKVTVIFVHNDGKGWVKKGNAKAEPDENDVTSRPAHLLAALCDFSKILREDAKLTRMPDEKVGDRDAAVINAKTPDGIDTDVFIDTKTGWVIQTRKQQTAPGSKTPISMVLVMDGHKNFQEGVYATRMTGLRDGKAVVEVTILDLRFLEEVDSAEFSKP